MRLVLSLCAVALAFVAGAFGSTTCSSKCVAWQPGAACKRGKATGLSFGLARENATASVNTTVMWHDVLKYEFCPSVDQLQAFELTNAIEEALARFGPDENATYVYLQGGGPSVAPQSPTYGMDTLVPILEKGGTGKTCAADEFAVSEFLVFNFTMTNGMYKWTKADRAPVQVGFQPTCKDGACLAQGAADLGKCMGYPGRTNCARCYKTSDLVRSTTTGKPVQSPKITVWASYYGTDVDGRVFESGSLNPLNFEQFASTSVVKSVVSDVHQNV